MITIVVIAIQLIYFHPFSAIRHGIFRTNELFCYQSIDRLGLRIERHPPGVHVINLSIGPSVPQVRELQGFLNLLPTSRPPLATDARFEPTVGRLGIFAAQKAGVERAVILVLPPSGVPNRVNICITQGFGQASTTLDPLGWSKTSRPSPRATLSSAPIFNYLHNCS